VARPLHQVIHKGGDALGTVEPGFGKAISIEAGYIPKTHGQPRIELLRKSASPKARHHKLEQVVTEGGFFFGCAPLGRHEVGSVEKRVHENTSVAHRSEMQNNGAPCGGRNHKTHPLPEGSSGRTSLKQLKLE
jgi:hypothetical protein